MLSKRTNDFVFIGIILLVIGAIVGLRFYVLGTLDDRIESEQVRNEELLSEINQLQSLISENPTEAIPPISVLYQRAPSIYDRNRLNYYLFSQLELIGISETGERNVVIGITENPTFPEDSTFNDIANSMMAVRVRISFNPEDVQMMYDVINHMHHQQQYFVLQSIAYNLDDAGVPERVTMDYVTFYNTE